MLFNDLELIDRQVSEMISMSNSQLTAFQAEQEIETILNELEELRKELNND